MIQELSLNQQQPQREILHKQEPKKRKGTNETENALNGEEQEGERMIIEEGVLVFINMFHMGDTKEKEKREKHKRKRILKERKNKKKRTR